MKESRGDRDPVINTGDGGAQWKLGKPKGTNWRMLQCASPAGRTGTEVSLMTTLYYSVHTSNRNPCLDAIFVCLGFFLDLFLTDFEEVIFFFLFFSCAARVGDSQSTTDIKKSSR